MKVFVVMIGVLTAGLLGAYGAVGSVQGSGSGCSQYGSGSGGSQYGSGGSQYGSGSGGSQYGSGGSQYGDCGSGSGGGQYGPGEPPAPDVTPPTITCSPTPSILRPADGRLVKILVAVSVTDTGSGPSTAGFRLVAVTSNEPAFGDIVGFDVGQPDVQGFLRAIRRSAGHDRVYSLRYSAADKAGNRAECVATITVPRAQHNGHKKRHHGGHHKFTYVHQHKHR